MISNFSKYNEQENDWAFDIKEDPIHISLAESGAKGYFCMGCNKEMQAVKFKNPKHQSYFRHHATDIDHSKEQCVHSSREYREKLAYFYFLRVKQIKVPAIYKFPPKGEEGMPNLLQDSTIINAHRVEREVIFFEDENGEIKWGKNTQIDERFLMIRPDAVFFDKKDKPILFIEFVITHKPDTEKLNKLKRLGINTVQIIIPKLAEPELEKSISQVSKVKWTYNEIESNSNYISIPSGDPEGIPSIDEEQRKLFEESYTCRAAQIGNLIRAIKRCVESQSYYRAEQLFEQEISRIEEATREHQSRLEEIQGGIEQEIFRELEPKRSEFEQAENKFQEYYTDLEKRYTTKRWELIEEQRDIDREIERRHGTGRAKEDLRREFRNLEDRVAETQRDSRNEEERINEEIKSCEEFESNFRGKQTEIEREFEQLEKKERESFESRRTNFESKYNEHREVQNIEESRIRGNFEREYQQVIKRINNRDVQSGDELSARIKTILDLRGLFDSYTNGKNTLEKYRKGIAYVRNGTWKKWDK